MSRQITAILCFIFVSFIGNCICEVAIPEHLSNIVVIPGHPGITNPINNKGMSRADSSSAALARPAHHISILEENKGEGFKPATTTTVRISDREQEAITASARHGDQSLRHGHDNGHLHGRGVLRGQHLHHLSTNISNSSDSNISGGSGDGVGVHSDWKSSISDSDRGGEGGTGHPNSGNSDSTNRTMFAMCLIVKDDPDIAEWIEYHHRIGASKIYIFDNNSSSPTVFYGAKPYIMKDIVKYTWLPDREGAYLQAEVYHNCLQNYRHLHQFMGYLDSDEYIVINHKRIGENINNPWHDLWVEKKGNLNVPDILSHFTAYGGLTLNWMFFGSSGHIQKPPGGIMKNYNMCRRYNLVKTIANMDYTTGNRKSKSPHVFAYQKGYYAVDINRERIDLAFNPHTADSGKPVRTPPPDSLFDTIYINHYYCKSREEFEAKVTKRGTFHYEKNMTIFYNVDRKCTDVCPYLEMPPLV